MQAVSIFTPVTFNHTPATCSEKVLNTLSSLLYMGGKQVVILKGSKEGVLIDNTRSWATTFKVVLLVIVFPVTLLMYAVKVAIQYSHHYHILDVKKKLEEGVVIPENIETDIQYHLDNKGFKKYANEGFHPYLAEILIDGYWYIIPEPSAPKLAEQIVNENYAKRLNAEEICLINNLDLIIPRAKIIRIKLNGNEIPIIVQKQVVELADVSMHEQNHYLAASQLKEETRQLAILIGKLGFNNFTFENIPLVKDPQTKGYKIGVEGIENVGDPKSGLLYGLLNHVFTEEQVDAVLEVAKELGIDPSSTAEDLAMGKMLALKVPPQTFEEWKNQRLAEIAKENALYSRYKEKGILKNPTLPIEVGDFDTLGLQNETGMISVPDIMSASSDGRTHVTYRQKPVTMEEATNDILKQINERLENPPKTNLSAKYQRRFILNTSHEPFQTYDRLGAPPGMISDKEEKMVWIYRILEALQKNNHLQFFKDGHNYIIQG